MSLQSEYDFALPKGYVDAASNTGLAGSPPGVCGGAPSATR